MSVDLGVKPFYLNDEQQRWVRKTLAAMDTEQKMGQLFCEAIWNCTEEEMTTIFSEIKPGGVLFRPNESAKIKEYINRLQEKSDIPMLIAGNFERGGNGGLTDGTYYGTQMQVAATNDVECGERLGIIAGREGAAVGFNWSFAPIIDIDYNFLSTVTNTRTFGSDPDKIIKMAKGYLRGIRKYMAATIKHFPGDGMDLRDQHKVSSVNTMTVQEWDATYGKVYKALIDEGVESVMTAHIRLPLYSKFFNPDIDDRQIMPASLSYDLNVKLLREKLGFNGLIVSDDTHMAGFMAAMEREKAVPASIAAGVDMFLFTVNHREDVDWMRKGIRDGVITMERLDEAVTRILALKARLNLHRKDRALMSSPDESVINCDEHRKWSMECADKAVTLVKDVKGILPLSPKKYPRILLHSLDYKSSGRYDNNPQYEKFKQSLLDEGFQVTEMDLNKMPGIGVLNASIRELKENYDLMIYFAGAKSGYRIEWKSIVCGDIPSYVNEIDTLAVSFGSPYLLLDMPMVSTYINAYSENDYTRKAVIDKLMGRSPFKGVNPVDPFCGMWDLPL
jgi:beta-N-acetylhexosaminidase